MGDPSSSGQRPWISEKANQIQDTGSSDRRRGWDPACQESGEEEVGAAPSLPIALPFTHLRLRARVTLVQG